MGYTNIRCVTEGKESVGLPVPAGEGRRGRYRNITNCSPLLRNSRISQLFSEEFRFSCTTTTTTLIDKIIC